MSDLPEHSERAESSAEKQTLTTGEVLTRARMAKGLSVEELAVQLKLAPAVIQGIECGDMTHLPPRSFIQGYIRACAKVLELAPDAVLALWEEQFPKPPDAPLVVTESDKRIHRMQRRDHRRVDKRKSRKGLWVIGGLLIVLIVGGFYAKSMFQKGESLNQLIPALSHHGSQPLGLQVQHPTDRDT